MTTEPQILSSLSPVYAHLLFCRILPPSSTSVENPLQISYFLCKTNPISSKAKMNLNSLITTDYENKWQRRVRKNKPNSNPIKPNFRKAKMTVNSLITKDYIKYDDFVVRKNKPNSNPISSKPKMSANLYVIEDYENETAFRPQKNKPKQTQFQTRRRFFCLSHKRLPHACGRILVQSGIDLLKYVSRQTTTQ